MARPGFHPSRGLWLVAALILPLLSPVPALAQSSSDTRALTDRLDRLSRDMQTLQAQVYRGKPPPPSDPNAPIDPGTSATAQLEVRVGAMEDTLRQLNGQIEELNFNLSQMKQRIDRMATDTDYRLSTLEKAQSAQPPAAADTPLAAQPSQPSGPATPPGTLPNGAKLPGPLVVPPKDSGKDKPAPTQTAVAPAATPPVALPAGSPKEQYDYAFDLLIRAQYAQAEGALKAFIAANPSDPLTANAQYWLGESFFARQNYADAAAQFLVGYQKYPQSPKAPDNLLKLGLSLQNLNKKDQACQAYGRFAKEYPSASLTLKRRVTEEQQRLACSKG
jgi:tol-pal system protein YbgF